MPPDRLFTPRFFVMCGFTFTVFLSAFQLLPTAPFHILDLGGSTFASGLFLGFLTYSSAFSAPLTGAYADRIGQRRMLIISSLALSRVRRGLRGDHRLPADPGARDRARGVLVGAAVGVGGLHDAACCPSAAAPKASATGGCRRWRRWRWRRASGSWIYRYGWVWLCVLAAVLNLVMVGIALILDEQPTASRRHARNAGGLLEWRVLVDVADACSCIRSATAASRASRRCTPTPTASTPKGIYLTALAIVVLLTRPFAGRLGDRIGYKRVFMPCLVLISVGLACLAVGGTPVLDADLGADLRRRVRHRVSGLRRLRHARRVGADAAAPRSGRSWRRSTPASAPGRRRSAG